MTHWRLVLRSLQYHRRSLSAVALGSAVATAILVGALGVGDSVRHSLARLTALRLGGAQIVVTASHGLFRSALATQIEGQLGVGTSPLLLLRGTVSSRGATVARVQIVGVESSFWNLGGVVDPVSGETLDRVAVNRPLALALGLAPGEELVVRVERPDSIPGELPFRNADRVAVPVVGMVAAVVADDAMGRFDLEVRQTARPTVFLPLGALAAALGAPGRANCILVGGRVGRGPGVAEVRDALSRAWRLPDVDLQLRPLLRRRGLELVSGRVLLPAAVEKAALAIDPDAQPVLSWLATTLAAGDRESPYAFVSAPGPPLVPDDIADDQMIVTEWLAEDLGVTIGDEIRLDAFVPNLGGGLAERSAVFRVREIVALTGAAHDSGLMPPIPGLHDAEDCHRWDPGLPIDLDRIRPRDEAYWDRYGGTPKAYIGLGAARDLWAGRFGSATAVRFAENLDDHEALATALAGRLQPGEIGILVDAVRARGLAAGAEAVDFGQLFVGLSWFLIVAALLMTGLLFVLAVEQRRSEYSVLAAVGFERAEIFRLALVEGAVVAIVGTAVGTAAGWCYTWGVVTLLNSVWRGAVRTSALVAHVELSTLGVGGATGAVCAGIVLLVAGSNLLRKQGVGSLRATAGSPTRPPGRWGAKAAVLVAVLGAAAAISLVVIGRDWDQATSLFWLAGGLMLVSLAAAWRALLGSFAALPAGRSVVSLGLRRLADGPRRALVSAAVLAIGVFVVVAVAANRSSGPENPDDRRSGTGGFAWWVETSIPFRLDLEGTAGRRRLGLEGHPEVQVLGLTRRRGDDASCLNLHQVKRPSLLGIPVASIANRESFTFVSRAGDTIPEGTWRMLEGVLADGSIPAVADDGVIRWALGLALGDVLTVTDERGRERRLTLVGSLAPSVFQGHVLISAQNLGELYPSTAGYEVLLLDDSGERSVDEIATGLRDWGPVVESTSQRLAAFRSVQDTYLSIFLALGGLGLLLGTAGVGVLALRDVIEQRSQLAVLRAVGLERGAVARVVSVAWGAVISAGVLIGAGAALVAILPVLRGPGSAVPWVTVVVLMLAITLGGWLWARTAARWSLGGDLLSALRHE